jgi:hypothetical protein
MEWVALFAVMALVGALIGKSKGKAGLGFVLGLFLGVIGWIVIALIPARPAQPKQLTPEQQQSADFRRDHVPGSEEYKAAHG